MVLDRFDRALRDLRISVTDRCNFRCTYCMPGDRAYQFLPRQQLLSFEEITRLCRHFSELGTRKLRLTGGEPLLRKDLPELIRMLAEIPAIEDIALTTNGFHLADRAKILVEAGLQRITVSLDSLDPETFARLAGKNTHPSRVLDAIDAAAAVGLGVKVNVVVQKGINDGELVKIAGYFRERGHIPRFIEFMDVGNVNAWRLDQVVTAREMLTAIDAVYPCEPADANYRGEVARRYRYKDGKGEFGLITSVSQPFCRDCNRARLSADGHLFTCLFASKGHDLKTILREGSDEALRALLHQIWGNRDDRYSELRGAENTREGDNKVEMYHIGG